MAISTSIMNEMFNYGTALPGYTPTICAIIDVEGLMNVERLSNLAGQALTIFFNGPVKKDNGARMCCIRNRFRYSLPIQSRLVLWTFNE